MPSPDVLAALEAQLHDLIRSRAARYLTRVGIALPDLRAEPPTGRASWVAIPGMYGGFSYRLAPDDPPRLIVESWSRVVAGSGQRHEVSAEGWHLLEAGFA